MKERTLRIFGMGVILLFSIISISPGVLSQTTPPKYFQGIPDDLDNIIRRLENDATFGHPGQFVDKGLDLFKIEVEKLSADYNEFKEDYKDYDKSIEEAEELIETGAIDGSEICEKLFEILDLLIAQETLINEMVSKIDEIDQKLEKFEKAVKENSHTTQMDIKQAEHGVNYLKSKTKNIRDEGNFDDKLDKNCQKQEDIESQLIQNDCY